MQELPLNGFYESTTPKNSARRCVNLIPINEPNGSLSTNMLECPSGISGPILDSGKPSGFTGGTIVSQIAEWENNTSRPALFAFDNYILSTDGVSVGFGQIPGTAASIEPSMFDARFAFSDSVGVAVGGPLSSGGAGASFDKSLSVTLIDLVNIFGGSPHGFSDVAFLGGRFIWMNSQSVGTDAFRCYYSDIGGTEPLTTNFFQPDIDVSGLTGVHVLNGQLWLFDDKQAYLFSLTSSTTTPFQWQRSATRGFGLYSPNTKTELRGSLFMLASDDTGNYVPAIFSGGQLQQIGNSAVNYVINNELGNVLGARPRVFSYTDKGRDYVVFTAGDRSFVYGVDDGRWFERETDSDYWKVTGYVGRGTDVFVGEDITVTLNADFEIGNQDDSIGTEFGDSVERYVVSAPFNANNATIKLSELEPVISSESGENADVTVSISKDFGTTFGTERTTTKTDDSSRTRFLSWGAFRQAAVVKIKVASDFPVKIVKLLARMTTGGRGA